MTDTYTLYSNKKTQLTSVPRQSIENINVELEKARVRSNSPKPVHKEQVLKGKVVYEKDIDEIKHKLELSLNANHNLEIHLNENIEKFKLELEEQKKFFESIKTENLKNAINDAVKSFNENIKTVANELVNHQDCLNTLNSRVQTIEDVL